MAGELDLATIGVAFDTSGLKDGQKELGNTAKAGDGAADSMKRMEKATADSMSAMQRSLENSRRVTEVMRQQIEALEGQINSLKNTGGNGFGQMGSASLDAARDMAALESRFVGIVAKGTIVAQVLGDIAEMAVRSAKQLGESIYASTEAAAKMHDLSIMTGLSVESLSAFNTVGKTSDTSVQQIAMSMNRLSNALSKTNDESKGAGQALASIGLNVREFQALSPDEKMMAVAKAVNQYKDSSEKAAVAQALLGRGGAAMLPFLKDLAETGHLAAKVTTEQANAADEFTDNLTLMKVSGEAWKTTLAMGMVPAMSEFSGAALKAMNDAGGFRDQIKSLAEDGSLERWTRNAISGATYLLDAFAGVGRVLGMLKNSIDILFTGVATAAKIGAAGIAGAFTSEGQAYIAKQKAEWGAFMAEMKTSNDALLLDTLPGQRLRDAMAAPKAEGIPDATKDLKYNTAKDAKAKIDAQVKAYESLIESIESKTDAVEQEMIAGKKLDEADRIHLQIMKDVALGKIKEADAFSLRTTMALADLKAQIQLQEEEKAALKISEERQKMREKEADGIKRFMESLDAEAQKAIDATQKRIDSIKDEETALAVSRELHITLAQAIGRVTLKRLEDRQASKFVEGSDGWNALQAEIDKQRELLTVIDSKAVRETNEAGWKSFFDSIDSTARSVWTDVWHGGQDAFTRIGNTIKAAILDMLYQITIKRWIIGVQASVTGGAVSAGSSAAGGASGLGGLFSAGSMGGQFMNGMSAWGEGGSVMGMMSNPGLYSGMEMLGAAAPMIGAGLLAYSLISKGGAKPSIEGGFSTADDPGTNGKAYTAGADGLYYGGALDGSSKSVVTGMGKSYTDTVKLLGGKAGSFTASEFTGIDQNGHASAIDMSAFVNGKMVYNRAADVGSNKVGSSDAEVQAAVDLGSKKAIIEALKATDMEPLLNDYLSNVTTQGKTIEDINANIADLTSLAQFRDAIKLLPEQFSALGNASSAAVLKLSEVAGGMGNVTSALGNYYDLFFTDAEKQANTLNNTKEAFAAVGQTMPALDSNTREWYKSLVKQLGAQDLSIESNAKAYYAVLKLAGAVDTLAPAADSATAAIKRSTSDIASEKEGLMSQLYTLTGDTASLRAKQLSGLDDSNKALQKQIWALQDQKRAITDSKAALDAAVATQRTSLNATINQSKAVFDMIGQSVSSLYGQVQSTASLSARQGQAFIESALTSGAVPSQQDLSSAINAVTADITQAQYATAADEAVAKLQLAGELSKLKDKAGLQLSTAQLQLDDLDKTVKYMQDQIDATNGVKAGVLSIADSVAAITLMLDPAKDSATSKVNASPGGISAGSDALASGSMAARVQDFSVVDKALALGDFGGNKVGAAYNLFVAARSENMTEQQLADRYGYGISDVRALFAGAGISAFASGGYHSGGLRLVGENGPEIEATGPARYYSATTTAQMLSGGSGNMDLSPVVMKLSDILTAIETLVITSNRMDRRFQQAFDPGSSGVYALNMRAVA